ncbi:MAG: hypothetical protein ABJE95_35065 [Byssovorax sp.]
MPSLRPFGAALALALLASPAVARAADDPAETLFQQGVKAMEAGRYEAACPPIEQSYRIDPRIGTLFALAECESKRGRVATSVGYYEAYLTAFGQLPRDKKARQGDRAAVARRQIEALGRDLPRLTLVLPREAPRDMVVSCDGAPVSEDALGAALPLDPGDHVITTSVPGGAPTEVRLKLGRGQQTRLVLTVAPAQVAAAAPAGSPPSVPDAPPAQNQAHGTSGRRVGAYVVGSIGLAGLVVGGVFGGLALGQKSVVDANCTPTADPGTIGCHHDGYQASRNLQQLGLWSTVGFAVGAAGAVVAVVLFATEPARPRPAALTSGLRRVSAGLSAGPGAATVRIEGAW